MVRLRFRFFCALHREKSKGCNRFAADGRGFPQVLGQILGMDSLKAGTGCIAQARAASYVCGARRTFVLLERIDGCGTLAWMEPAVPIRRRPGAIPPPSHRLFYRVFLPLAVLANLTLGIVILAGLHPTEWSAWLEIGTGAFCCVVAGVLGAAAMSTSYWNRTMVKQIAVWRQIVDTFFGWVEDAPVPTDAVHRLHASLDKVMPSSERS